MASSPPPSPTSYYALLQVPETASPQDLRQAFRGLSKRYHPDTTVLPPAEAAAAFQQLQQAYAVLSDPAQRQRYDAQLHPAPPLRPPSPPPGAPAPRPASVRRDLSGGEWLALLLLGFALLVSLVLGVGVAWMRGVELVQWPSWWSESAVVVGSEAAVSAGPDSGSPKMTGLVP
ncbi:J domain-containing protein [Cyanobium sp. FACHB-13342]|nr:J domain-containing protein [Cyanobium sp. FACHB-13342]MBD2423596.1 J domain-containing protein [Cyanobium sp. FACHB-13342]